MKIIKTVMILGGMMLLFSACETDVTDPAGARDEGVVPGIENLNPAIYFEDDIENTYIQFDLTISDSDVDEAILVVSSGNERQRKKVTSVSSFPATVVVPLTDVAAALGMSLDQINGGDIFAFEIQTIQGGKTYYSSAAFKAAVACAWEVENVTGAYNSSSGWGNGGVTLEADPDDEFTVYVHGLPALDGDLGEEVGPLVLIINPLDFSVQAPGSVVAATALGQYNDWTLTGFGILNTCDGTYEMNLTATVDAGSFGADQFVFTKQ